MVDVRPKDAIGPTSNARLEAALIRDAKAYHSPSAEQLAALTARLEPHLDAYERQSKDGAAPRAGRRAKAWGMTLPALAAALLPYLYFNHGEPAPLSALVAAPHVRADADASPTAPSPSLTAAACTALGACGEASFAPVLELVPADTATAPPDDRPVLDGVRQLQLPKARARSLHPVSAAVPATDEVVATMASPELEATRAPQDLTAAHTSPVNLTPVTPTPIPHVAAAPPGRYGAMQALAVRAPMFARSPEVHAPKVTARPLTSPSELSPRMSAAASTVAPWTL